METYRAIIRIGIEAHVKNTEDLEHLKVSYILMTDNLYFSFAQEECNVFRMLWAITKPPVDANTVLAAVDKEQRT